MYNLPVVAMGLVIINPGSSEMQTMLVITEE